MVWWEELLKPGMNKLFMERGKVLREEKKGKLNLLLIRQAYLVKKLHEGKFEKIKEHKQIKNEINEWYKKENEMLKLH